MLSCAIALLCIAVKMRVLAILPDVLQVLAAYFKEIKRKGEYSLILYFFSGCPACCAIAGSPPSLWEVSGCP